MAVGASVSLISSGWKNFGENKKIYDYFQKFGCGGNNKVEKIIEETINSKGNITSKYTMISDEVLELAEELLGFNYKEVHKTTGCRL